MSEFTCDGMFDAKVHAERKNKDGIFLTLLIHPNDYSPELAALNCGATLKVGWAEIVDTSVHEISMKNHAAMTEKPKRAWADLSPAEQCGIRCGENDFWTFIHDRGLRHGGDVASSVRFFCRVASRSELNANAEAAKRWGELESGYQSWLTDKRYGDARR